MYCWQYDDQDTQGLLHQAVCKNMQRTEWKERIYQSEQTLELRNMTTIVPSEKKIRLHKAFRNVKQLSSVVKLIDFIEL